MNFLTDPVKKLYGKFLVASMGSALVMSIYSFVDTIAVGQAILRKSDVYSGELGRMDLSKEIRLLIDRYVSEQNAHSTLCY